MAYPEQVETERLLLRRWTPGGLDSLVAIWSDEAVAGPCLRAGATPPR